MGRHGPLPQPAAVKIAKGETRPSQVNYEAPVPRQEPPSMPSDMEDDAKAVWRHVLREMRGTGIILGADAGTLRRYCEAEAAYVRNLHLLNRSGPIIRGARGNDLIVNPVYRLVREEREAARLLSRELGLSPAARAGLRIDASAVHLDMDAIIGPPPRLRIVNG